MNIEEGLPVRIKNKSNTSTAENKATVNKVFDNFKSITKDYLIMKQEFLEMHGYDKKPELLEQKWIVVDFIIIHTHPVISISSIHPISEVELI